MKLRKYTIAIIILFFYGNVLASAELSGITGDSLLEYCNSTISIIAKTHKPYNVDNALSVMNQDGLCRGYLLGILDAAVFNKATDKELLRDNNVCLPDGLTINQLAKVTSKYLNDHPEDLHLNSLELVLNAFGKYFPCKAELDAAMNNMNKLYNQSKDQLCDSNPSPTNCTYTCFSIDPNGDKILCHWPNGKGFSYKKINESNAP
jgi:hypothetical protein